MERTKTATRIKSRQSLELISATVLQDLSDAESQTIQGGGVLIALLVPAVQAAREAGR